MRDQPHAWQHRSNDAAESATGTMPTPREPADDDRAIPTDNTGTDTWAPERDASLADSREASGTDVASSPDLDAPTSSPDVDAASGLPGEPAVGVAQVRDSEAGSDERAANEHVAEERAADERVADERMADERMADERTSGDFSAGERTMASDEAVAADDAVADRTATSTSMTGDAATDEAATDDAATDDAAVDNTAFDNTTVDNTTVDDAAVDDAAARDAAMSDAARSDAAVGEPGGTEGNGELMPGDVPEQPARALFDGSSADDFRDRWQRVQMRFVDNPRGAADEARVLTDDVVSALHNALNERIGSLGEWQSGQAGDTEELRVAVRRYRDLLDRLLGL